MAVRDIIDTAIDRVLGGARAGECETSTLDFKEDRGSSNDLESAIARAAICFANAAGGRIVVGISDKAVGPAAVTGTNLDADRLRQRILELTNPPMLVNVEVRRRPARLVVVEVLAGSAIYADTQGRSWHRVGTACVPLAPMDQARIAGERSGFDWSAQPTSVPISEASPQALRAARVLLERLPDDRRDLAGRSAADLFTALGATVDRISLNRAGEVLFCERSEPELFVYQYKTTPGGEPRTVQRLAAPALIGFERILELVSARQGTTPVVMPGGQQIAIEDFPSIAVREALSNALCHRDWQVQGPITIDHSPEIFSIVSPGPLVAGVTPENILTMPSRPRNRTLTAIVRRLGLAEETGRGVDRMFRETIRSGRQLPNIEASPDHVKISFVGGAPDTNIARFVTRLPAEEREDTDTMLVLYHLCRKRTITAAAASVMLQKSAGESETVLRRLATEPAALLETTKEARAQRVYRLRGETIQGLGAAVTYNRKTIDETDRKIIELVREYGKITNRALQTVFDVHVFKARDLIASLQTRGILTRVSVQSRGSGVEWGPGPRFPRARSRRARNSGSGEPPASEEAAAGEQLSFRED